MPRKSKEGEAFVFCNGAIATTLAQCKKELKNLTDEEFNFHINESKNDIYNWVKNCLNEKVAEKIKKIKDKKELISNLKY